MSFVVSQVEKLTVRIFQAILKFAKIERAVYLFFRHGFDEFQLLDIRKRESSGSIEKCLYHDFPKLLNVFLTKLGICKEVLQRSRIRRLDPTGICITDDRVGERDVAKLTDHSKA